MSVATGTATSYLDLMEKFRDFITTDAALVLAGQQWECIAGVDTGTPVAEDYMSFKGTGLAGADEIFFSVQAVSVPANNYYNLAFYGHIGYNLGSPGVNQVGNHVGHVALLLNNSTIVYWFIANGRRAIIITRISGRYDAAYLGLVLPDHLPNDWSYPLFIGASAYSVAFGASDDTYAHTNFWMPALASNDISLSCSAHLFTPGANWRSVANGVNGGASLNTRTEGAVVEPWNRSSRPTNWRRTLDDQPWLQRGQIASVGDGAGANSGGVPTTGGPDGGQWYGSFDGVFFTPSFGAAAEQIVTVGGVDHILIPNISRTGDSQYAAIALE